MKKIVREYLIGLKLYFRISVQISSGLKEPVLNTKGKVGTIKSKNDKRESRNNIILCILHTALVFTLNLSIYIYNLQ